MRGIWIAAATLSLGVGQTSAQSTAALLEEARWHGDLRPREALERLRVVLDKDSLSYEANWRATVALVSLGQEIPDSIKSRDRDSLYLEAEQLARRAIRGDSRRVEGHFVLGMALGRVALTKGKRDRVRYAKEIYESATRALAIAPEHDGAHHLLALWHAEAMRISGFNRFMAKNLLGGKILSQASWERAIEHLETAVRIDPTRIFHRLDLAQIYFERKRYQEAKAMLNVIAELPNRTALDPEYRRQAAALLSRLDKQIGRNHDR